MSISNEITRSKAGGVRVENAKIFMVTVKTGLEMSISEERFRLSSLETRLERQGRDGLDIYRGKTTERIHGCREGGLV